ncbi:azurin [uncultured Algibacter sp.]|uniref:azurin n=1 Tax=uncultured Algibacter sp. TaxID=298659 RepID=UPI0030ED7E63|tara:strand:+ start:8012 stop:8518 length:507 start_codon:yes stop_codon:yes gene_type:complete
MKAIKVIILVVFSISLISCGGKDQKKQEGFSYDKNTEVSNKAKSDPNDVVITSNDAMQFNKKEIKVKAGKKVKITLKHIGKMDKNVMGHNFVLLKQGVDIMMFGNKAGVEKDNSYIPTGTDDVIAFTKVIGGGETAVVEFDAPEKGTYDFLCSFPGHYAIMKGKFIVE